MHVGVRVAWGASIMSGVHVFLAWPEFLLFSKKCCWPAFCTYCFPLSAWPSGSIMAKVPEVGQCCMCTCNQVCMQSELQSSLHAVKFACTQSQSCKQVSVSCSGLLSVLLCSVSWPLLCLSSLLACCLALPLSSLLACCLALPLSSLLACCLALPAAGLQAQEWQLPIVDWKRESWA